MNFADLWPPGGHCVFTLRTVCWIHPRVALLWSLLSKIPLVPELFSFHLSSVVIHFTCLASRVVAFVPTSSTHQKRGISFSFHEIINDDVNRWLPAFVYHDVRPRFGGKLGRVTPWIFISCHLSQATKVCLLCRTWWEPSNGLLDLSCCLHFPPASPAHALWTACVDEQINLHDAVGELDQPLQVGRSSTLEVCSHIIIAF